MMTQLRVLISPGVPAPRPEVSAAFAVRLVLLAAAVSSAALALPSGISSRSSFSLSSPSCANTCCPLGMENPLHLALAAWSSASSDLAACSSLCSPAWVSSACRRTSLASFSRASALAELALAPSTAASAFSLRSRVSASSVAVRVSLLCRSSARCRALVTRADPSPERVQGSPEHELEVASRCAPFHFWHTPDTELSCSLRRDGLASRTWESPARRGLCADAPPRSVQARRASCRTEHPREPRSPQGQSCCFPLSRKGSSQQALQEKGQRCLAERFCRGQGGASRATSTWERMRSQPAPSNVLPGNPCIHTLHPPTRGSCRGNSPDAKDRQNGSDARACRGCDGES
mmetsp:Transcript_36369/g.86345  ORF Transcript_36369/g.86345 Transcript_36369/m.86345 type:complete len:347 (-) Transcript_36369:2477-3517(-)